MNDKKMNMPMWRCHKIVQADQIMAVDHQDAVIHLKESGTASVTQAYLDKHQPAEGGYYVLYEDGYASYSPQQAFENGYTRLSNCGSGEAHGTPPVTGDCTGDEPERFPTIRRDELLRLEALRLAVDCRVMLTGDGAEIVECARKFLDLLQGMNEYPEQADIQG